MKVMEILKIPSDNQNKHENLRISYDNHENYENPKVPFKKTKIMKQLEFHWRIMKIIIILA